MYRDEVIMVVTDQNWPRAVDWLDAFLHFTIGPNLLQRFQAEVPAVCHTHSGSVRLVGGVFEWGSFKDLVNILYFVDTHCPHTPFVLEKSIDSGVLPAVSLDCRYIQQLREVLFLFCVAAKKTSI